MIFVMLKGACVVFFLLNGIVQGAQPPAATVVTVIGKALVRSDSDPSRPAKEMRPKDSIFPGDVINTGSKAQVKLLFTDKSIIDVTPSTLFKVDEYLVEKSVETRKVALSMQFGKIRASINKPVKSPGRFQFRAKSATMGVRGTEILLGAELEANPAKQDPAAKVDLTVLEGKVAVTHEDGAGGVQERAVEKGQAMSMSSETPALVKTLSTDELQAAQTTASKFAKDMTFNQAIGSMDESEEKDSSGRSPAESQSSSGKIGFSTLNELTKEMKDSFDKIEVDLQSGIPGVFDLTFTPPLHNENRQSARVGVNFSY